VRDYVKAADDVGERRVEHTVAEHRLGITRAQHIGVTDAVPASQRRVHEGHGLVAHIGASRRIAEIDVLVEEVPQSEGLGQCGRRHQASSSKVRRQFSRIRTAISLYLSVDPDLSRRHHDQHREDSLVIVAPDKVHIALTRIAGH
jgi:hypothetical protein